MLLDIIVSLISGLSYIILSIHFKVLVKFRLVYRQIVTKKCTTSNIMFHKTILQMLKTKLNINKIIVFKRSSSFVLLLKFIYLNFHEYLS